MIELILAAASHSALAQALQRAIVLPISLGVNRVANFSNDQREAVITRGWRDNGNAHGYSLFTVMMREQGAPHRWNIVGVEQKDRFDDAISDSPHTGEDVVSAVRFVKAQDRNHPRTLLVAATRDWKDSIPEPAATTIEVFALTKSRGDVGKTQDYFARVLTVKTTRKFCNADMALHEEAGLPLPPDYSGGLNVTGCIDGR